MYMDAGFVILLTGTILCKFCTLECITFTIFGFFSGMTLSSIFIGYIFLKLVQLGQINFRYKNIKRLEDFVLNVSFVPHLSQHLAPHIELLKFNSTQCSSIN